MLYYSFLQWCWTVILAGSGNLICKSVRFACTKKHIRKITYMLTLKTMGLLAHFKQAPVRFFVVLDPNICKQICMRNDSDYNEIKGILISVWDRSNPLFEWKAFVMNQQKKVPKVLGQGTWIIWYKKYTRHYSNKKYSPPVNTEVSSSQRFFFISKMK